MSELLGIYTLWMREVKRYFREKSRIISSLFQPLIWLVIFGSGIRFSGGGIGGLQYQEFIFPGIIGQSLLFTSMFMGISVIWDREFGFLKEILVAPISRFSVFIGKMLGGSTDAVIQGALIFVYGYFLGIRLDVLTFLVSLPIMLLITFGLVSVGILSHIFPYGPTRENIPAASSVRLRVSPTVKSPIAHHSIRQEALLKSLSRLSPSQPRGRTR